MGPATTLPVQRGGMTRSHSSAQRDVTDRRGPLAVIVLLLACTFVARLPDATHYALWQDEIATERVITAPTARAALSQVVRGEATPPAFYLTAWATGRAASALVPAGRQVASLRLLSVGFGLGTTALTVLLACEFLPLWAAALAGFITSFASILVLHGAELRAYSLLAMMSVLFAFLVLKAVGRPAGTRLAMLSGAVAIGSLTHYFFLLTFTAGALWLVTSGLERAVVRRVGLAFALGLVPLAVWSPYWLHQYQRGNYGVSPHFTFARLIEVVPVLFAPQAIVNDAGPAIRAVVFTAVIGAAVAAFLARRNEGRLCALLVLLPLFATAAIATSGQRVFNARNLIGVAPFAAICISLACASLPWGRGRWPQVAAALVGVLVAAGYLLGQVTLGRTAYDRIARAVTAQESGNGEPIAWFGPYGGALPVGWYLTQDAPSDSWPRIVRALPTSSPCPGVEVVARNAAGRRWLDQHRAEVLARTVIPSHGDNQEGKRQPADVIVARLRWSAGILDRATSANALLFHRAGVALPCLRP